MLSRRLAIHGRLVVPARKLAGVALGACLFIASDEPLRGLTLAAVGVGLFWLGVSASRLRAWARKQPSGAAGPVFAHATLLAMPGTLAFGVWVVDAPPGRLIFLLALGLHLAYIAGKYGCWVKGCCRRRRRLPGIPPLLRSRTLPVSELWATAASVLVGVAIVAAVRDPLLAGSVMLGAFAVVRGSSAWLQKPWTTLPMAFRRPDVALLAGIAVVTMVVSI